MLSVELEVNSNNHPGSILPSIATFQNGVLNPDADDIRFKMYKYNKSSDAKLNRRKYLEFETERLSYLGRNFGTTHSLQNDTCKTYVGVLNKKTGKMKVTELDWFNMHPYIQEKEASSDGVQAITNQESRRLLTETFGTTKSQKIVKQNRLQTELAPSALEELHKSVVQLDTAVKDPMENIADILPPVNREATEVENVFDPYDLITDGEYNSLLEPACTLANGSQEEIQQWRDNKVYCSTVLEALQTLAPGNVDKAVMLTYLNCLIAMASIKNQWFSADDPAFISLPEVVYYSILDRFSQKAYSKLDPKKRKFLPRMRDKLQAHILAVGLIACNYTVDLGSIARDLGIKTQRLEKLGRLLGGRYSKVTNYLTLSIPLAASELIVRKRTTRR